VFAVGHDSIFVQAHKNTNLISKHICLQFTVIYGSGEGYNITDVTHTGQIHNASFKAKTKARVSYGAVSSQIQIEIVVLLVQTKLLHSLLQQLQLILTLAAADNLTDTGNQTVHSRNSLAVLIQLHVESLNLLGIIGYKYGTLKHFLSQITLMLGL